MCCVLSLLLVYVTAELPVNAKAQPAQAWPTRPIKLIVPTGARTATDIMARLVASAIDESLGQPVVVENMPGAPGILAHRAIARLPDRAEDLLHRVEIDAASSPLPGVDSGRRSGRAQTLDQLAISFVTRERVFNARPVRSCSTDQSFSFA